MVANVHLVSVPETFHLCCSHSSTPRQSAPLCAAGSCPLTSSQVPRTVSLRKGQEHTQENTGNSDLRLTCSNACVHHLLSPCRMPTASATSRVVASRVVVVLLLEKGWCCWKRPVAGDLARDICEPGQSLIWLHVTASSIICTQRIQEYILRKIGCIFRCHRALGLVAATNA